MSNKEVTFEKLPKSEGGDYILVFAYHDMKQVSAYRLSHVADAVHSGTAKDYNHSLEIIKNLEKKLGIEAFPYQSRDNITRTIQSNLVLPS